MCCTRLAENTGRKKVAKKRHLGTIAQICRAISSQIRHVSTIGKNMLSPNMSSTCPHNMVNFGPLRAEIGSTIWGTPANFHWFRVLLELEVWHLYSLIMVALCNRADHYIFMLWFVMAALCNRGAIIFLPCSFFLLSSIFYLLFFLA